MDKNKTISTILDKNKYVKETWAEYADSALTPKHAIYRYDDNKGNRFYYFLNGDEVVIAAGSTTVFGEVSTEREGIDRWKENNPDWKTLLRVSAEYGTLSHEVKGDIMLGKGINSTKIDVMERLITEAGGSHNTPTKDLLAFLKFQEDYQLVPLLIEASLVWQCPESGEWLAQTIDLLARMTITEKEKKEVVYGMYQRGPKAGQLKYKTEITETQTEKILLVDFKSNFFEKEKRGFYETHKLQLQAAKLAVEQNFDIKVDDLYNFSEVNWQNEPKYTFHKWELSDEDWEIFYTYWKLARLKKINRPKGKILLTSEIKNSNDYTLFEYKDYIEQILLNYGNKTSTESLQGD